MASSPIIEQPVTDIVPAANAKAAVVLFDQQKFDAFFAKLKADVEATPIDLATKKGRDAIASVAAKVRSEKASIDKDRLRLTAEWRNMTAQVNGAWNGIKEQMDALAIAARKPLTEWEQAEKDRNDRADAIINQLARAAMVGLDETAADVRERGMAVYQLTLDPALFGDKLDTAQKVKGDAVDTLKAALARLTREEEDRAELQRLRDEAAARAEADRLAAEQAESERLEAARIEAEHLATERAAQEAAERAQREQERQIAAQKAEAERIERAKVEAAEQAARKAQEAAKAEQDARDREHARQLAEAQAERDRIAAQEKARIAEQEAAAAAQAKRDADQAHRTKVKAAAKTAIMSCGADEDTARKIVMAIIAGEVPAVSLRF